MAARRPGRLAIIGAGSAGLSAIQEALEIGGFQITVYERRAQAGGIWDLDRLQLDQQSKQEQWPATLVFDKQGLPHMTWSRSAAAAFRGAKIEPGLAEAEEAERRPPSAIYDGLRTNIPSDLMSMRDQPFGHVPLFPQRSQVFDYLRELARKIGLDGTSPQTTNQVDVRFHTRVKTLYRSTPLGAPTNEGHVSGSKWTIVSQTVPSNDATNNSAKEENMEEFDHVILASGRCNTPIVPYIPGLWNFRGQISHSAWYRTPWTLAHRNVLVLGNSSSGFDICRELVGMTVRTLPLPEAWERTKIPFDIDPDAERATRQWVDGKGNRAYGGKVIQSIRQFEQPPALDYDPRDPRSPAWAQRIQVVPRIDHIDPPENDSNQQGSKGTIVLTDGQALTDIDTIIFGTGYYWEFPFLDQNFAPFAAHPLVPPPAPRKPLDQPQSDQLQSYIDKHQSGHPFERKWRTVQGLMNLDQWQLFYRYDNSLAILGMPLRIVPFPLTQVQARYALQYWAGLSPPLTKLDYRIPSNDPDRWIGPFAQPNERSEATEVPCVPPNSLTPHDLGTPSDVAYTDGLVRHINPHAHPIPARSQNGLGDGVVRWPEKWDLVPTWRKERRANGKILRRRELGY